ncbi:MAG: S9 family peptidase [Steroidobacteraceae bacterium]
MAPLGDLAAAKPVTADRRRGIRQHLWSHTGRDVLYLQDEGGDENWHVHAVDVESGADRDLTPIKGVAAQLVGVSWRKPGAVLVALNDRVPEWHDLYEIDIRSGARRPLEKNVQEFAGYAEDLDLRPRIAVKSSAEGGDLYRRTAKGGWEKFLSYGMQDSLTTAPLAVEGNGRSALLLSSVGRDKAALVRLELASGAQTVIGESPQADVDEVWLDPRTRAPQAWSADYLTPEFKAITPAAAADVRRLTNALGDGIVVASRTLDDTRWIVVANEPTNSLSVHLYDRRSGSITKLFDQRPQLAGAPLVPMQSIEIPARDGLQLVSYLSLPAGSDGNGDGRPDQPVPLVLDVHGGPWARDAYGFNGEHQWFANRGYAVLSVNYRGSTGFGKAFINAGNREWAGRMHDDLLDAVQWAIEQKITTGDQVAIFGGSYGGYATLTGLTFTPERFACGVSIVGPSNLNTLLASIPPYWKSFFEEFALRVGDPRTEEGRKLLAERSPLTRAAEIRRPLLIAQGANDPRVKQAESDQIVAAMKAKGLPVTYVLYPDEGHGFARPQNRTSFYAIAEGFLSKCLGGRYQPVGGDFGGSSLKVLEGVGYVPGLAEALGAAPN